MHTNRFDKRSKRSARVRLTTMAALGSGAMLSACGGDGAPSANAVVAEKGKTEVQVFENVFACAAVTGKTRDECQQMRDEASARAVEEAPRFAALQDCEAEYGAGKCVESGVGEEEASTGRRHYSPFIVAWFSNSKSGKNAPLFNSKGGGYQSANGARLSYAGAPGKYYASNRAMERTKSVPKVKPASKMAKAGGFGSRNGTWNLADRGTGRTGAAGGSSSVRSKGG